MAKSTGGRSQASDMWYEQIKDQPASSASVSALQKYLSVFSDGDSVAAARAQLEAQQKQLADPAFRAKAEGLAAVDAGQGSKAVAELQKPSAPTMLTVKRWVPWDRLIPRKAIVPARWRSSKRP